MNDTKQLYVTMSDGTIWAIKATVIAHRRAVEYANAHAKGMVDAAWQQTYDSEMRRGMGNDDELLHYATYSMTWKDVRIYATLVGSDTDADYHKDWETAPKRINSA